MPTDFDTVVEVHGRVNLIGEHTDYNCGYVLPTCIPQTTVIKFKRRADQTVMAFSQNFGGLIRYELGEEERREKWSDYVQGVTVVLAEEGSKLTGFECWIESSVPVGSGLSSSAALEVALLKGLNQLFALELSDLHIAQLGQKAENEFVGAQTGIMDQMVISLGHVGEALFIDTLDLSYRRLPLPFEEFDLVVVDSGVKHSLAKGGYNRRRLECQEACQLLGIERLRALEPHDLKELEKLPPTLQRRARHVITENARVLSAVEALESHDLKRLGLLFMESHLSMRDDYEVSIPEIDALVERAVDHTAVFGARLTGGGFGGSIVALVKQGYGIEVGHWISEGYTQKFGKHAAVLVPNHVPRGVARDDIKTL